MKIFLSIGLVFAGCVSTEMSDLSITSKEAILEATSSIGSEGVALPLITGWGTGGAVGSFDVNNNVRTWGGGTWNIPVAVKIGEYIGSAAIVIRDALGTPTAISIVATDVTTHTNTTLCTGTSTGSNTQQPLTLTCNITVIPANTQVLMQLTSQPSAVLYGAWVRPSATEPALEFSPTLALPSPNTAAMQYTTSPPKWDIGNTSALLSCPIIIRAGSTISALQGHIYKASGSSSAIEVHLMDTNLSTRTVTDRFLGRNSTANPGPIDIGASGLNIVTENLHSYELRISETDTAPGPSTDFVYGWQVVP